MESIHAHGIRMAESLQQETRSLEKLWLVITHVGDPKAAFLLLFPFVYFANRRAGVAVLWVGALADWLNLMLKWVLFGERPYWWIGESHVFDGQQPKVQQFSTTCENGPGSPSGHAMVTAAVWWVVASSLASFLRTRTRRLRLGTNRTPSLNSTHALLLCCSTLLSSTPFLLYAALLLVVGISRVFILAHFPHQVVSGSIAGLLVGIVLNRRVPEGRPLLFFFSLSVSLLAGAMVLYLGMQHLGMDLSWSLALAKKWCQRDEWLRSDVAPFSSLTRDCGTLLGLGLAEYWKPGGWRLPRGPHALSLSLSSVGLYYLYHLPLPLQPPALYYSLNFAKFAAAPPIVMALVPGLVHLVTRKKRD